jgi:hypothetical protein
MRRIKYEFGEIPFMGHRHYAENKKHDKKELLPNPYDLKAVHKHIKRKRKKEATDE